MNTSPNSQKYLLIYNPNAGKKRSLFQFKSKPGTSLEDVRFLLEKYQIPVDLAPTKAPGHASQLAKESIKKGYKGVLVAGGDGTVGEAANGLIDSDMPLGILPFGSFMNTAKMLSVPFFH
jgi:diacylglycerol kinase family enzyme